MFDYIKLPKTLRDRYATIRMPSLRIPVPAFRLDVPVSETHFANDEADCEDMELYQNDLARFTRPSRNDLAWLN